MDNQDTEFESRIYLSQHFRPSSSHALWFSVGMQNHNSEPELRVKKIQELPFSIVNGRLLDS